MERPKAYILGDVAGNLRSLVNAVERVGYEVKWIESPQDISDPNVQV